LNTQGFVRIATLGSEDWNFSLWASGNGAVIIDLKIFIDGTEFDEVDSGNVNLNEVPQRVDFTGGNLPDNISKDQTIGIRWTVNSNNLPFVGNSCTIHWGSADTPTNLSISAGMYQIDDPYLESEGTPFRGEHENYSRTEVIWAVQVRWALGEEQLDQETLVLHGIDGYEERIISPTEDGTTSEGGVYRFEFEEWNDGVILTAHVMWNDSSGYVGKTEQMSFMMDDKGPSILSSGLKSTLFYMTIPILIGVGFWLMGRYRTLVSKGAELGHGPRKKGDLKRLLLATTFLIAGINNALIIYSFHTRELGASEDIVILHLALMAFALGAFGALWGAIADKWGHRKQMMTFGVGGAALLMLTFPFLPLEAYIIATTVQIALFSTVRVGVAVGTEWFPEQKGEYLGVLYAFASFAAAVASMVCSRAYVLLLPQGTMYAMLGIVAISAPALFFGAWMVTKFEGDEFSWPVWMLKGEKKPERVKMSMKEKLGMFRGILRFDSKWALLCLLGVVLVAIPRGAVVLTALRYLEVVGFDVDFTGLLEAWAVIAVLILYAVIGRVCDDRGPQTVLLWSAAAYGTLWSIFSIGLPPLIAVLIFVVPIYPMLLVSNDALMAKFTSEEERNRGIGMASLVAFIGQSIGIVAGFFVLGYLIGQGKTDIVAYEMFYRANIPLWILAITFTYLLAKRINASEKPLEAELSD
jgi:MFS family permease